MRLITLCNVFLERGRVVIAVKKVQVIENLSF